MDDARLSESGPPEGTDSEPGAVIELLRETAPLVQCVTNAVVVNFTANALLAVGASPVMADVPGEAGECVGAASALLVNLGTPSGEQREAMLEAAEAADASGTPWVLDPVGVGALGLRTAFAQRLIALRPTVVRGNASEILALTGSGAGGRGVDAADTVDAAIDAAVALSARTGSVVAVSGEVDAVVDGDRVVRVAGGSALLTRVTGGGCSLGAVVAAAVAAAGSGRAGSVTAHALYAVASERAAARAEGPGSFAVAFLDALAAATPDDLSAHAPRIAAAPPGDEARGGGA
ncbi:hydroxyethylthiazole kinase [Microbacterium betulae]|uniref:Hydroxyethylthiazole kinase n=1 Tax=Microbacterium betulae TaxID=2981139 RepID=A0AA97FJW5_9MICO|nr:hydroxyethylthiazole kinase [Microbacterium sp. AB]WOF24415.1 hydroxyethylthiazole kinase [Microbacterium sp. AB]